MTCPFFRWSWFTRVDYIYKSGSYDLSADLAKTPATNLVNLKIGVETDGIQVEGFIDNLTNETAYTNVIPEYRLSSPAETEAKPDAVTVGLPNLITFGLRARYKFGGPVESSSVAAASYTPPPVVAAKPATMARSYMVFFDFNKSDLTPQATAIVDTAAKNAGPSKATELVVTGHNRHGRFRRIQHAPVSPPGRIGRSRTREAGHQIFRDRDRRQRQA